MIRNLLNTFFFIQVSNDFYLALSSIIVSLRNNNFSMEGKTLGEEEENVARGFEMVMGHFNEKFMQTFV